MAIQERDELLHLVRELPDEDIHELLVLARLRGNVTGRSGRLSWVGILHEGPDFAKRAKETLRAESYGPRIV
jgi:hypothetical protein